MRNPILMGSAVLIALAISSPLVAWPASNRGPEVCNLRPSCVRCAAVAQRLGVLELRQHRVLLVRALELLRDGERVAVVEQHRRARLELTGEGLRVTRRADGVLDRMRHLAGGLLDGGGRQRLV